MNREGEQTSTWRSEWLPLGLLIVFCAAYFLCFFNRFSGLRSGDGEFGGGIAFLAGLRPYRDYFTAGPPLNVFKSAVQLALFGKLLIVSRALAVCERLLIATVLYAWLRRLFSQQAAVLGTLLTIVVSAGDHTDPLASYNHDAILLSIVCGLFTAYSLGEIATRKMVCVAALAGAFGALSLLTKQTVGGCAILAVVMFGCAAQANLYNSARAVRWLCAFISGALVPIAATVGYLWHLGAFGACLQMMFVSGPKAKASHPFVFLAREVMVAGLFRWWLLLAIVLIALSAKAMRRGVLEPQSNAQVRVRVGLLMYAVAGVLLALALMTARAHDPLQNTGKAVVYFVLIGVVLSGLTALQNALHADPLEKKRSWEIALLSGLSLAVALSLSLSFPVFEAMALPGFGLLFAAIYDGSQRKATLVSLALAAFLMFLQMTEKFAIPFGFDHQDEDRVYSATQRALDPMLWGMRLPPATAQFIDEVEQTVRLREKSGDTIFTYPEMGLLYSLVGRYPPTRTASHNIDVVEDAFAESEALRLLAAPPAVIIYAKPSDEEMRTAEMVWREGRRSGQRSIMKAVEQIVSKYDLVGTYKLTPRDTAIRIYARPVGVATSRTTLSTPAH